MAAIETMERGKLCRMTGRPHYNLQSWHDGRNRVRYVPLDQAASVQRAIDGYREYRRLAEEYAEILIDLTRKQREKEFAQPAKPRKHQEKKKKSTPRGSPPGP
ncbi:MAG: hypothetical protein JW793_11295 [Acidobacteria bacterium]|nr:hypothetical protein [Acidobacteriota bacterium]